MTGKLKDNTTKTSKQTGYKVLGLNNDWNRNGANGKYGGVGWYRIINPLEKLGCDVERSKFEIGGPERALKMRERGDIWFIKQAYLQATSLLLTEARFTDAKLVLDLDDDPFGIDPQHPNYQHHKEKEAEIAFLIENVDHVVVSTEPLKHSIERFNKKVTVIPNAIDPKIWEVKRKKRNDGKIRIGWIGSASHLPDLQVVSVAIKEILKKYPHVEMHTAGMSGTGQVGEQEFYYSGTQGYEEFPQFMADLDLDIGIAPLKDTQFNRCKSNIKWLEHAMLKIPMVLSNVYPYEYSVKHGKTGYLAKNKNQWVKYLSWLIENEEKRKEIGENAYQEVMDKWTIDKQLPKYDQLFTKLMEKPEVTVITAITNESDVLKENQNTYGAKYICFTDNPELKSDVWEIKPVYDKFKDPRMNSKIHKVLSHKYADTPYTIWIDGSIEIKEKPTEIIKRLEDKDIAVFRHVGRDCIYEEADACLSLGKGDPKEINEQIKKYAKQGIKSHGGLAECTIIIRRNTPRVNELNEKWWAEICRHSVRDQLSFPVIFPEDEVQFMEGAVWDTKGQQDFKWHPHK